MPHETMTTAMMANTPWDCRWIQPGYHLSRVSEDKQPESLWVCVRPTPTGDRRPVTEEECANCPRWEAEPAEPGLS